MEWSQRSANHCHVFAHQFALACWHTRVCKVRTQGNLKKKLCFVWIQCCTIHGERHVVLTVHANKPTDPYNNKEKNTKIWIHGCDGFFFLRLQPLDRTTNVMLFLERERKHTDWWESSPSLGKKATCLHTVQPASLQACKTAKDLASHTKQL